MWRTKSGSFTGALRQCAAESAPCRMSCDGKCFKLIEQISRESTVGRTFDVGIRRLHVSAGYPRSSKRELGDLAAHRLAAHHHDPVSYTHLRAHETPEHL